MTDSNDSTPIFRSITVHPSGVVVTLGQALSAEAMALCVPAGPNKFKLKDGTYKRAETIIFVLGVGAAVQQMDFSYAKGTDYQDLLADFENELGPPDQQSGDKGRQLSVWEDDSTRFALQNSPSGITSELTNLAPTES
jgi:hypothetical protein